MINDVLHRSLLKAQDKNHFQHNILQISSASLARNERRNLSKAATSLATASVKLGTHMVSDYSLYWILNLISYHARYQSKLQGYEITY